MRRVLAFLFLLAICSGMHVKTVIPHAAAMSYRGVSFIVPRPVRKLDEEYPLTGLPMPGTLASTRLAPGGENFATEPLVQNRDDLIRHILSDTRLWGKDFPTVLAALPSFNRAGESRIAVFPDRIVGEHKFKSLEAAGREAENVTKYLNLGQIKFRPEFETLFQRGFRERAATLKPEPLNFLDDDTKRVAVLSRGSQFLAPGLTIATVRRILGEPEKITKELLDNGERRPIILKLHHYAGGAIAFAESNWTTRPGDVDRAFLNVPATTAAVFQEIR